MELNSSTGNLCRICLNVQDTLFSLYRKRHGISPYEKLISRTKLNIQLNDSGPPSICSQCLIDLDTTVGFLDMCERSNQLLSAKFAQNIDESSNCKLDSIEIELEPVPLPTVSCEQRHQQEVREESKQELFKVIFCEEKCPECGSKRRCKHWAPPTSHTCQYCDKTFNKKYNYQLHVKRHLGENDFCCSVCGTGRLSRWTAERHCREQPRQHCPVRGCNKSFTTNTNLHIHIRTHSGERPFECDDCGKTFISKNILNNHMRIHTGVKPYMCQICGKQFATNKLSSHMARHAGGDGGARRHACPEAGCPRAFRTPRALRDHRATHAPLRAHACALCHATYKFKQSLNYHVKNTHGFGATPKAVLQPGTTTNISSMAMVNNEL